jgi:hypothetical protein
MIMQFKFYCVSNTSQNSLSVAFQIPQMPTCTDYYV